MLEPHPQLPKFQPYLWIQPGSQGTSLHQCQVILTFSPGSVQEDGALPMPGLHVVPWGQNGKGHLAAIIHAIVTHFNHLATCVIKTCPENHSVDALDWAMVVELWIEVVCICNRKGPGHPLLLSLFSRYGPWSDSLHKW
jgi:hypothetical protein